MCHRLEHIVFRLQGIYGHASKLGKILGMRHWVTALGQAVVGWVGAG